MISHFLIMVVVGTILGFFTGRLKKPFITNRRMRGICGGICSIAMLFIARQVTGSQEQLVVMTYWLVGVSVYLPVLIVVAFFSDDDGGDDRRKRLREKTSEKLRALVEKVRIEASTPKPRPIPIVIPVRE